MYRIRMPQFFSILISFVLCIAPLPLAAIAQELIAISKEEMAIINEHPCESYIYLAAECSPIIQLVSELSSLDKNTESPFFDFKNHIESGHLIIKYNHMLELITYAENFLQENRGNIDIEQKEKLILQLEEVIKYLSEGLLTVDAQLLKSIETYRNKRSYTNIATVKGLLSVNDQLVQNITAVDLSATDATIQNLTIANAVTNLTVDALSVINGSVSGTLSVNDEIIKTYVRFNDAIAGEYIGLQAPTTVPTSYTLSLPPTIPTAYQVLRANATTPTNLEWATESGSIAPTTSKTIYVTKYGNDSTGNGSFDAPYLTLAKAIDIANSIASAVNPIAIVISSGVYTENNSAGPLSINVEGVSIVGESASSVIILPTTPANDLLLVNDTVRISNVTFRSTSALATGISLTAGNLSVLSNVRISGFLIGVNCSGGATETYGFNNCLFVENGTAIYVNDTKIECNSCSIFGVPTIIAAANTGLSVTGANSSVAFGGGVCALCETAATVTNDALVTLSGISFRRNMFDIVQDGASHLTLSSCTFEFTDDSSDIDLQVSGAGTVTEIIGCEFSGTSILSVAQGTGIQITDSALVNITGSIFHGYVTAIHIGTPSETLSTVLTASSVIIRDCTTDILQEGATTLQFNAGTASSSKISIDDSTNVDLAFFDLDDNGALTIGSTADQDTALIQIAMDTTNHPGVNYKSSLYSSQAVGFDNTVSAVSPTTFFALSNQNTDLAAITTDRTKVAGIELFSDEGSPVGGTSALRGWNINKNASTAELSFNYQNSDLIGQSAVSQYTIMQLDGLNNVVQLPATGTQIVFGGDTNLYRSAANVLETDDNFIVGTLTPNTAVYTDSITNQLTSSSTTGTELGYLSGVTSSVQTQINSKVAKAGDTMTGTLQLPAGTVAAPSLVFTGSTTTGLSAATANTLSLSTNGVERLKISPTGTVSINDLTSTGVVHNDTSGNLSTSLIVNADITNATISNAKLATISSSDVPGAIVVRDGAGNFEANMITIDGAVTNPTDVATKSYVDSVAATGITAHTPALVVSTSNVSLSGLQTIDGVALVANDRVLLVNQTDPVENGLWQAQSGSWTRPTDFDTGDTAGQAYVLITSGLTNAGSSYLSSTPTAIIDTDPIEFSLFSLPDVTTGANVGAGTGLVFKNKTGATLNFRSLIADTHTTITTNTDDITFSVDATPANTPSTIVSRDGSGNFVAGTITASLTGAASLNVLKAGDTMTGALQIPAGTNALPSLKFTGSTTTGFSAASDILSFNTAATERMRIGATGIVAINNLTSTGVVHNNASGELSSSLIVNADIDAAAAIVDTKLATISTAGKVANSATTATSANTANAIVARDASGNFSAGTITASLTGSASNNVLKTGDTMTGSLQLPAGTTTNPSLVFTGSTVTGLSASSGDLSFSTDGIERMKIANGGTISVNEFTVAGVVHNDASGNLSSALIVNADIDANAAIIDTKLATISTSGKVANSATTATSANAVSTIILRDSSGNFSAGRASLTDAVIQNLTITNCLANFCATELSTVDTAISGSLSVNDEVVDGSLTITPFSTAGVVHNNSSGLLSSSLIVNADVSASAAIVDTKLATIATAGKVANSATTATAANTANAIVARDGSGDFSATMITLTGAVTNPTDAATKEYVDTFTLIEKTPALVVSTTNVALSGLQTIDGVTLITNNRVLLINQTNPVENGLWEAQSGSWTRPTDFNTGDTSGTAYVLITNGANNAGSSYLSTTPTAIIDTDPIAFTLFSAASSTTAANVGSGTGLIFRDKTGVTLNLRSLVAGTHITVTNNTDDITIATDATSANTPSTLVARNASGNFSAGAISVTDEVISNSLTVTPFTTAGVVHNNASGLITSSLIVNADVDPAAAIVDTKLATISTAGKVANSATTATSANTANAIVARDASGNFSAGTITANLSGNATTATTATNFSGSLAGDVTGTQGATVVSTVDGQTAANVAAATVLANAATNLNTANAIVRRDSTGSFAAQIVSVVDTVATGNLAFTGATSTSTTGNITKNGNRFIHNFGTRNTFVGNLAGNFTLTGTDNTGIGNGALNPNATGTSNTAVGSNSLTSNTTGSSNTAIGRSALFFNTTGRNNTALGSQALASNTTGVNNIAVGSDTLLANITGGSNIAIGSTALASNITGSNNTAIGDSALLNNTTGNNNTAIGISTLFNLTTGSSNIAIGQNAGATLTTGSGNIYIDANAASAAEATTTRIGTSQTQCFVAGVAGVGVSGDVVVVDSNGQFGVTLSSERFKHNIQDMADKSDAILHLRPVTFVYNDDATEAMQYGLLAEEVDKIFPTIVSRDEEGKPYTVRYQMLPVLLLNEIQKQRTTIEEMKQNYVTREEMNAALDHIKVELQKTIH